MGDNLGMGVLVADRSERGKLRFTGEQRAWFLHQILTQAFEDIAPGEARESAMLTAKGRMRGYMEVVATEDALLMHFEPDLLSTLPEEISRYVFATRVEIEDVTQEMGLVLLVGDGWESCAATVEGAIVHPTTRWGAPAGYLWVGRGDVGAVLARLTGAGAVEGSDEELEGVRIEHGAARWGHDMDFASFPQEPGVDDVAVHYSKGCYTGQEAMAKIKLRGKVNRHLRRFHPPHPVPTGAEITSAGAKVGSITSSSGTAALGLVKYTISPGDVVEVDGEPVKVEA